MMAAPRTEDTKMLEVLKRQFFQWYYIDGYPQTKVKESFDTLFEYLRVHEGRDYRASYNQWTGRRLEWNKKWNIAESQRGTPLPTPPGVSSFELWFKDTVPDPFNIHLCRYFASPFTDIDTTTPRTNHEWGNEGLSAMQIDRSPSEPSPASLPFFQPFYPSEPLPYQSAQVEYTVNVNSAHPWSSASTLQAGNQNILLSLPHNTTRASNEYGRFGPSFRNLPPTSEDNISPYARPRHPLSTAQGPNLNMLVEPAVPSSDDMFTQPSDGSQLQSQGYDLDPISTARVPSANYDPWIHQPFYDGMPTPHRHNH